MKRFATAGLTLACLLTAGQAMAQAATPGGTVSAGRLVDIPVSAPDDTPTSLVVYLSDRSGWKPGDDAMVEALRESKAASSSPSTSPVMPRRSMPTTANASTLWERSRIWPRRRSARSR